MEKEKLSEIINKKVLYIIFAVLSFIMCGVQVFFIIVEHGIYTGGVWYMIAVAWLLLTGLFIYKYIAAVRDEKEEVKRIAEFKEKYKIK